MSITRVSLDCTWISQHFKSCSEGDIPLNINIIVVIIIIHFTVLSVVILLV